MSYDEESELTSYVWGHYAHLLTPHERLIGRAFDERRRWEASNGSSSPRKLSAEDWAAAHRAEPTSGTRRPAGLADAYEYPAYEAGTVAGATYASSPEADEATRRRAALRILAAESATIQVPRCPRCTRVLKSENVPACYWCGLDWHDGRPLPKARR